MSAPAASLVLALEHDLSACLRSLASRGDWSWASFVRAWRLRGCSGLHAVLAGGLSPGGAASAGFGGADDDAGYRGALQAAFGLLLSWPSRPPPVRAAHKVAALHFLALLWASQPLARPEPVRVGPWEWRAAAALAAAAAPLRGACLRGLLARLHAAGAFAFAAYAGPRGLDGVGRAARALGLGDALVVARGPAAPLIDYVNEAIHYLRLKELAAAPPAAAAAAAKDARMAKAQSARLANAKANNNPPRDTGPQQRARQVGAMLLLATGRARGLHAAAAELRALEAAALVVDGGGGGDGAPPAAAADAFARAAAAAGAGPLPPPPLQAPAAGGLRHFAAPARLVHCVAARPTPLSTVEGMLRPSQRAAKAQVAAGAAAPSAADRDDDARGDAFLVEILGPDDAAFMRTVVEAAGAPAADAAPGGRAGAAAASSASPAAAAAAAPSPLFAGRGSAAASLGPWAAAAAAAAGGAAAAAGAAAACAAPALAPRLPAPSLEQVRAALTPDLLSAPPPAAAAGGSGGAARRGKRQAPPPAAPTPAPTPAPLLPAWRAVEVARAAAAAAAPRGAAALLAPDLPGAEVVELSADVSVAPLALEASLRALQALLVAPPRTAPASAAAAAAAPPAAAAAGAADDNGAADADDPLAAACWCRAPQPRTLAAFADAIDGRIVSHVERLMLWPPAPPAAVLDGRR